MSDFTMDDEIRMMELEVALLKKKRAMAEQAQMAASSNAPAKPRTSRSSAGGTVAADRAELIHGAGLDVLDRASGLRFRSWWTSRSCRTCLGTAGDAAGNAPKARRLSTVRRRGLSTATLPGAAPQ